MHSVHLHFPSMRELRHGVAELQHLIHGRAGEVLFVVAVVVLILIGISGRPKGPGR
jgi:hypothetical protein